MNSSKITNFFYLGSSRLALARVDFSNLSSPRVLYFKAEAAKHFVIGHARDIENISAQVKRLFEDAELDNFPEITLILSHPLVRGYNFSSSIFYAAPHTIEPEDVEEVIRQTRSVAMVPIRERILQSVAQEFWVNDARGIHNPTDLEAERLGVSLRLLAIEAEDYRNIVKIFDRSEAEIETVLPKAYAASFAALEESEKRNGVLLLDAGGHSLDTVYFKDGMFSDSASLPWGGETLNQEMARRSHLGAGAIRRLKEEFGTFLEGAADEEMLPLEEGGEERGALRRGELRAHLEAGLATLWPRLDPVIERIRKDCGPLERLVLTGGASRMEGFLEQIEKRYSVPTRQGNPRLLDLTSDVSWPIDTAWCSLAGAVRRGLEIRKGEKRARFGKTLLTRAVNRTREWLESYF